MVYYLLVQPRRAAAGNFKSSSRLTEMAIYSVKTNLISAILQICVLALLLGRSGSMDYCYLGLLEAKIYIGSLIVTLNARTPSSSPEAFATPVDALPRTFSIHFSTGGSDSKRSHRRSGSEKLAKFASLIGIGRTGCAHGQRSRSVHFTVEQEVAVEQPEEEHELKSLPSLFDVDLEAGMPSMPPPVPRRYPSRPSYPRGPASTMFSTMSAKSSVDDRNAIAPFATEDEVRTAVQAQDGRAVRASWSGGSEEGRGGGM
ncbi:hypothetical protein Rt10032_c24g6704 [Rhodotorula toruloides]|uniref:DUF6534 domain-containing protein n=1 Tax=Rhodotorula toruloides TaxID=5286 RepID=A0A511KQN6_RHOTO|nr:hypothetical protein Rt10032_c24g6704 [Rhodotorula toruloides]